MNLNEYVWKCSCCGKDMNGLPPAMAFNVPDQWLDLDAKAKKKSKINSDFCLIKMPGGEVYRYIRCVMEMPLIGGKGVDDQFDFGVWMSISEQSWNIYWIGFRSGKYAEEGCFGYLSNNISTYPNSFNLRADIYFQPDSQRPLVELHSFDHPLVHDQCHGMKIEIVEALASKWQH
jgi:hypothetical protein